MDRLAASNPFAPGSGQLPPYLGGREDEQRALRRMLSYVKAGRSTPRDIVLIGPRGNGKTVLLRWFEAMIEAGANDADVVWLTPSTIADLDGLATALAPPDRFRNLLPSRLSLSLGLGRFGWDLGNGAGRLEDLLTVRCRAKPLVVLLDEAHTLTKDIGQPLLNVSQRVRAQAPFLLVLSGTPGLWAHLQTMAATFWDRCESIGVGRLTPEASADVLTKPMQPDIALEDAELHRVVEASQRYPFFLQLCGEALWDEAAESGNVTIDSALVDRALAVFEHKKTTFYQIRYGELGGSSMLLSAAEAVAAAFAEHETLVESRYSQVISEVLPPDTEGDQAIALGDRLKSLGYVWIPPGSTVLEPGIPSLMEFVRSKAAA